ncbi:MAG: hypothetical protein CVT63_06870 [Candidatus Anoxymicrobium japonicum]|uniref:Uncharacterized protein n=1 Tax=Candidatus Anoxymicrobium japonicum TaxID=2013648 RepID=A0A2N3G4J7_9ACTN|nr:MAG: hypothetical protein CVT63_06870 [Candidatus Anoxymicrobium japonicum]
MEILLLLFLVLGAGVVFLPEFLKERELNSPVDTVSDFQRGMMTLALSTHTYQPRGHYHSQTSESEPYFRRSRYTEQFDDAPDIFVPYPSNKARINMETRRNRILGLLLIVVLSTAIMGLIPGLKWIIPLHIGILTILAIYIALAILVPHKEIRRR